MCQRLFIVIKLEPPATAATARERTSQQPDQLNPHHRRAQRNVTGPSTTHAPQDGRARVSIANPHVAHAYWDSQLTNVYAQTLRAAVAHMQASVRIATRHASRLTANASERAHMSTAAH